jgi:ABC-type glycerol-3-phosphate transport system substrate-binding protein
MLMSNVLEAYELDSHLYSVAPAFQLYSMWGSNSVIKNKYGVTFNEIIKILKDNGKDINAIYGFSADEPVLTTMCAIGMDEFVDWKSGSCNFEGEGFQEVLRFAKEYSGGYTEGSLSDGIRNGSILLSVGIISDVADYKVQSELYGGEVSFIGYPTAEGSGTAVSFRGSQLAINAEGENKEAAWEFIKYYLLNGYQNEGFPVVKEQFDKIMSQAMEETYIVDSGEKYKAAKKVYYDSDAYIEIYKAEQKDVDAVKQLIKKADTKFAYHTNIQNIINEEAESYFKGQKELKEVTELIQNRVSLFLEEK